MTPDFNKNTDGLLPAIIRDQRNGNVLMLGYMNEEAFNKTTETKLVTFYSRSRQCLWTKGATSGNYLLLQSIQTDCDSDSLLISVLPTGPVCHTGSYSCFGSLADTQPFIAALEDVIAARKTNDSENSYTASLFRKGINKIAQKLGEEAVELVIEAKDNNDELFKNEAADLLFHYLVLLQAKGFRLADIEAVLQKRHQ